MAGGAAAPTPGQATRLADVGARLIDHPATKQESDVLAPPHELRAAAGDLHGTGTRRRAAQLASLPQYMHVPRHVLESGSSTSRASGIGTTNGHGWRSLAERPGRSSRGHGRRRPSRLGPAPSPGAVAGVGL